jgi:hypothetical protein
MASCWYDRINAIRARKLELARLDPRGGMPVTPPSAAAPATIASVERRLKRPLPPSYRAFLELHDGWPQFFHGASLMTGRQVARGQYVDLVRLVTDELAAAARDGSPASRRQTAPTTRRPLLPFGIDERAEIVFAFDLSTERSDGEIEVLAWINEIGIRVESFPAFLDLVLEMLEADIGERRSRAPYWIAAGVETPRPSGAFRAA